MRMRFDRSLEARSRAQCCKYGAILFVQVCSLGIRQMALEVEADQDLSDEPGSLMDNVLDGLISASRTPLFLVDGRVPNQPRR